MSDFTASNGIQITGLSGKWDRTTIQFEGRTQNVDLRRTMTFEDDDLIALREQDRALRDNELGWWRWPENPSCVVREGDVTGDHGSGRTVLVFDEESFDRFCFNERVRAAEQGASTAHRAARAFFEAHPTPEPKPWQNAKPGEVWVLTLPDEGDADAEIVTVATTYGTFTAGSLREWTLNDDQITSARQVPTGGAA